MLNDIVEVKAKPAEVKAIVERFIEDAECLMWANDGSRTQIDTFGKVINQYRQHAQIVCYKHAVKITLQHQKQTETRYQEVGRPERTDYEVRIPIKYWEAITHKIASEVYGYPRTDQSGIVYRRNEGWRLR